ncbi:MAG: peptidoglycan-binding protein [Syntrophales bacterium]|jgi:hypothetical protein|nr:peptidoglycan-binding protein [Syntrophales bacterium]MCK9528398.1 peptidoglycan-binding protein [Syntrophales bacterium]MDX9922677.1 peptidoglycan-binding domain-containing protein [Syntrophales bacterium]
MIRKITAAGVIVLMVWAMAGCAVQQQLQQSRSISEVPPFEINPPKVDAIAADDVPGDVRMVTAAIVQTLRKNRQGIPRVSFDPAGKHYTPETRFTYSGFSVTDISIKDHWARDTGRKSFDCRVDGSILFSDALGRRALVSYSAEYELFRDRILIKNSTVQPVPPIFPNTRAFIIEGTELQAIVDKRPGFEEFFTGVVSKSYSMIPTVEERRERKMLESMSLYERFKRGTGIERQPNFMVIFVMDRLTPDAEIDVVVSRNPNDKVSMAKPVYRDFDGWRVALFGGNFAVDYDEFYAQVIYRPALGVLPEGADRVLTGLFSSMKNYDAVDVSARIEKRSGPVVSAEGPIGLGQYILDPSRRDDASLIQFRLAELGFYRMTVDGLWGPGSQKALAAFQRAVGLAPDGAWDMQTQLKLFSGTGK